jgi:hypothetical protein
MKHVFLVVLAVLAPALVLAADPRNFWLLNNTGKTIHSIYISPHEINSWGKDVLGFSTLETSEGTFIDFDAAGYSSCSMDFKLVFTDGSAQRYDKGWDV